MRKIVCDNIRRQAVDNANMIAEYVHKKPDALLCLAAGDTPTATYAEMARMQRKGQADFRSCRLIGVDDWVGFDEHMEGSCKKYLIDHVIRPLELSEKNICLFDACSVNLEMECRKADEYLKTQGPIDISLMGVGMNGHIALNEPGCDFHADAHVVQLHNETINVAQKYFSHVTPVVQGITLGMKQIWNCNLLIIIANGADKQRIMRAAMYERVNNAVPASLLQYKSNCVVSLDKAADSVC